MIKLIRITNERAKAKARRKAAKNRRYAGRMMMRTRAVQAEAGNDKEEGSMDKQDFLTQIEEMHEKAQRLWAQLADKENHLQALEEQADAKKTQVENLDHILQNKQEEADGIVDAANRRMEESAEKIEAKLDALIAEIKESMQNGADEEELVRQSERLTQELQTSLNAMREDLKDHTHSESVKCFRNVQSSLDDLKSVLEEKSLSDDEKRRLRAPAIWALWFTVLNFLMIIGLIMYETGVFRLLMG